MISFDVATVTVIGDRLITNAKLAITTIAVRFATIGWLVKKQEHAKELLFLDLSFSAL